MRRSHQLPLVGLLLFSLIPSQLCEVCEVSKENYFRLKPLINTMVNSKSTSGVQAAYVLLSLRLAGFQNQSLEQELIRQVKDNVERNVSTLTSGELAVMILALGACQNPSGADGYEPHLVEQLGKKFQAEIEHIEAHHGNPLTNYYQLSLDLLTLCLFHGSYSVTKVSKLFAPENFYLAGRFSVDTGAVAVLALTCVKRSVVNGQLEAGTEHLDSISKHIKSLVEIILSEKKENGLLGNVYSTGEAMQALFVSSNCYEKRQWTCQHTLNTVLEETARGVFSVPTAASQVLPALVGKTYLDVNRDTPCVHGSVNFDIMQEPVSVTPNSPSTIVVHYSVRINKTYPIDITVPEGSVFLDVMEAAQKIDKAKFRFTTVETAYGSYVNSVQGISANNNDRTYWELLSGDKPLSQGAGSYVVHDGENLKVRWSKY
ncbi:PREDICTED: transcobalamin-1 [Condylura cristata]|uniref:transcobalamin-1 n=1 Tax=Condylura cristata TaxID=143302 RepID=UPI0003346A3A|nr:PREDICTED: transcobalamin-1 [Condylura cristata]